MNRRESVVICLALAACLAHTRVARAQERPPATTPPITITPPVSRCNDDRLKYDQDLDRRQRACIYGHNLLAPSGIFGAIGASGLAAAARMENPKFGTGVESFTLGVATRYAQSATRSSGEYLVDWALGQDPRASRHHGGFWHRAGAAAASLFVTSDDAHSHFKPGPVVGAVAGGFIALAWETRNKQSVAGAFEHTGTSLGSSLASAEFVEFG